MLLIWMCLSGVGFKEDTAVGNTVERDATKGQGFIAPHALTKTRDFIIDMVFPG